ncbi:MAG: glycosyltransferase family 4 protein [Caulobacterales bacterium]|nr:glycosyltransferase family 4 protein [Caulobacterales bacterium]
MSLRIAYAYEHDADDIMVQSGRPYSILRQLERRHDIIKVFPISQAIEHLFLPLKAAYRLSGRVYRADREPLYRAALERPIRAALREGGVDVVFSPGSRAVTTIGAEAPTVFVADAPFGAMADFYDDFARMAPRYKRQGFEAEESALATCAAAVYPSDWAANAAVAHHGADPAKVHVAPFGANIEPPDGPRVAAAIAARSLDPVEVLFIGRDWPRKGGPLVLEACERARAGGLGVVLHVVGVDDIGADVPDFVRVHGLLDKRRDDQRAELEGLLERASVLFVPSRAEAYGMTFCEAAAWGLPSLTTAVGGIPTIVREAATGRCLPPEAGVEDYAAALTGMVSDDARYRAMASAVRADYEQRLNWDAFAATLNDVLERAARGDPRRSNAA